MIEKFSEEELMQIKKELGLPVNSTKGDLFFRERNELHELWIGKGAGVDCIKFVYKIIDFTLNNFVERKSSKFKGKTVLSTCNNVIKPEDESEYRQMLQEILEIIKKHNRQWEVDND